MSLPKPYRDRGRPRLDGIIEGYVCDRCMARPGVAQDNSPDPVYFCAECKSDLRRGPRAVDAECCERDQPCFLEDGES